MPSYRRIHRPGGSYFFTLCLADRRSSLLTDHVVLLREAYLAAQITGPFKCDAMEILPGHLHMVWTLPPGDSAYARRIAVLKTHFSRGMRRAGFIPPEPVGWRNGGVNPALRRKGEIGLWQPRFWEHTLCDREDFDRHVAYCWANPVRHDLVTRVRDWPFSSFHGAVAKGLVPVDWSHKLVDGDYGEALAG